MADVLSDVCCMGIVNGWAADRLPMNLFEGGRQRSQDQKKKR